MLSTALQVFAITLNKSDKYIYFIKINILHRKFLIIENEAKEKSIC